MPDEVGEENKGTRSWVDQLQDKVGELRTNSLEKDKQALESKKEAEKNKQATPGLWAQTKLFFQGVTSFTRKAEDEHDKAVIEAQAKVDNEKQERIDKIDGKIGKVDKKQEGIDNRKTERDTIREYNADRKEHRTKLNEELEGVEGTDLEKAQKRIALREEHEKWKKERKEQYAGDLDGLQGNIKPATLDGKDTKNLDDAKSFEEAATILKESKGPKFTLAESEVDDKGNGYKVWDHPKYPKDQSKSELGNFSPEEYQALREAHQVTYEIKEGKVTEVTAGADANFSAAVGGTLVQKTGDRAEIKFGNVKLNIKGKGDSAPTIDQEQEIDLDQPLFQPSVQPSGPQPSNQRGGGAPARNPLGSSQGNFSQQGEGNKGSIFSRSDSSSLSDDDGSDRDSDVDLNFDRGSLDQLENGGNKPPKQSHDLAEERRITGEVVGEKIEENAALHRELGVKNEKILTLRGQQAAQPTQEALDEAIQKAASLQEVVTELAKENEALKAQKPSVGVSGQSQGGEASGQSQNTGPSLDEIRARPNPFGAINFSDAKLNKVNPNDKQAPKVDATTALVDELKTRVEGGEKKGSGLTKAGLEALRNKGGASTDVDGTSAPKPAKKWDVVDTETAEQKAEKVEKAAREAKAASYVATVNGDEIRDRPVEESQTDKLLAAAKPVEVNQSSFAQELQSQGAKLTKSEISKTPSVDQRQEQVRVENRNPEQREVLNKVTGNGGGVWTDEQREVAQGLVKAVTTPSKELSAQKVTGGSDVDKATPSATATNKAADKGTGLGG